MNQKGREKWPWVVLNSLIVQNMINMRTSFSCFSWSNRNFLVLDLSGNFQHSRLYGAVLWICGCNNLDNTPMFTLFLNSTCTASRLSLFHILSCTSFPSRISWEWARECKGTADPNWPKGYPTLYDVIVSNKSKVKGEWRVNICGYGICLPKQLLCKLRLCFPVSH